MRVGWTHATRAPYRDSEAVSQRVAGSGHLLWGGIPLQTRVARGPTSHHPSEPLQISTPRVSAGPGNEADLAAGPQATKRPSTIALADPHPLALRGLHALISAQPEFVIRAASADGATALGDIRRERPDIAVIDVNMPKLSGLEVLREVGRERLSTRIVFLTAILTDDQVLEAVALGVWGIILKEAAPETLVECLERVARGDRWLPGNLIQAAMTRYARRRARPSNTAVELTTREGEVADLVARCLSNKQIAGQLNLSEATVKNHLHNIYRKLAIDNRTALTVFALSGRAGAG